MTIDIVGDNQRTFRMEVLLGDIANHQFLAVLGDGIKTRRMEVKGLSLEISNLKTSIGFDEDWFLLGNADAIVNGL